MPRKNPHAVALGRRGGRVTSPEKARAVRRNGRLGGRKPKFRVDDRVVANAKAPASYREMTGRVVEQGPGHAEYGVAFDGDDRGTSYMMSWWLDPA